MSKLGQPERALRLIRYEAGGWLPAFSIGAGYGNNGPSGKVDFPIGGNARFGGWAYGDKKTGAVGVSIKF